MILTEAERVGKCVPWLDELPEDAYPPGTEPIDYVDSFGSERADMVYPVAYATSWPALPGLLNVGETVYERAKGGVSAIASQVAVARIYDDLAGGDVEQRDRRGGDQGQGPRHLPGSAH